MSTASTVILTVPAGDYTLKVTYIGYSPTTISNIRVNSGVTTTQDFKLTSSAVQVQAVEIIAERPLIQRNTTNTIRINQAEEISSLPFRGVQNIVALSAGAVQENGTLYVRGGRAGEVGYYVDGANATNPLFATENFSAIREAIEEVQLQTGGFTAELGGANSGIIRTTTKSGGSSIKASVDYLTDDFAKPGKQFLSTSSYGYRNVVGTVSGPVMNGIRFFVAGQGNYLRDRHPMFLTPFDFSGLTDDGLAKASNLGRPLPGDIKYLQNYLPNNWNTDNQGQGNVLFDLKQLADVPVKVRVSGLYDINTLPAQADWPGVMNGGDGTAQSFTNPARQLQNQTTTYSGAIKATHILSQTTFYEVGVSTQNRYFRQYDPTFGDNWMVYADSAANVNAGFPGVVNPWRDRYTGPIQMSTIQKFLIADPNRPNNTYSKNNQNQVGATLDFTSQVNSRWELKAGGSIDQWTMRSYSVGSISALLTFLDPTKSGVFAPDNVVYGSDVAAGYTVDERLRRARWMQIGAINTYGYDYKGNSTNGFTIASPSGGTESVDKPYTPTFASAYIQNKFEFNDLTLNFGLRYEYIDPKMLMMDPTLNPATGQYDYTNVPIDPETNLVDESQLHNTSSFSFLLPRLSFSFPVSDRTVFYTQFGKYVQMPSLNQLYNSTYQFSSWMNPNTRTFSSGALGFDAQPERTTSFEMGIRQVLTSNLAFTMTGFYKDTKDQLQLRRLYQIRSVIL